MKEATVSIQVEAEFDNEAGVWVATSKDVPGLVAEHANLDKLWDMVAELIPLLLIENEMVPELREAREVPVHLAAHALATRNVLVPA
jgi:hypothetical protein